MGLYGLPVTFAHVHEACIYIYDSQVSQKKDRNENVFCQTNNYFFLSHKKKIKIAQRHMISRSPIVIVSIHKRKFICVSLAL